MSNKYQKFALNVFIAVAVSLVLCMGLERLFDVNLAFKDLFVMGGIVIILKAMNKLLNIDFFKKAETSATGDWFKQLLEVLVITSCLVFILSGLSVIGYDTISFKKSMLLVVAAVPGIELFLVLCHLIPLKESKRAETLTEDQKSTSTADIQVTSASHTLEANSGDKSESDSNSDHLVQ